jgi:hypothetical protein
VKPQSKRESGRPVVDEAAFQQLLSAAYVMQEHNRRLKPVSSPAIQVSAPVVVAAKSVSETEASAPAQIASFPAPQPASSSLNCPECGSVLAADEFFCESCGAPAERPNNTTQKNWASLWEMHQASQSETRTAANQHEVFSDTKNSDLDETKDEEMDLFPAELEEIVAKFADPETDEEFAPKVPGPETSEKALSLVEIHPSVTSAENTPVIPAPATWTSAAKARAWLDSLKPQQSKDWFRDEWNLHRGTISIALASAVLLAVLFQWVTRPAPATGQTSQLSTFEQLLVSVGLAEAPAPVTPAPQPGNPNTKVWVDVHTALYYCPGADLYGKTSDGKYTTQLDAQRDNFQPSTLKACD